MYTTNKKEQKNKTINNRVGMFQTFLLSFIGSISVIITVRVSSDFT